MRTRKGARARAQISRKKGIEKGKSKKITKLRRDHKARFVQRSLTSSLHDSLLCVTAGRRARETTSEKIKKRAESL
jgi:uncharacterized protein YajQ (UPF0234 family)